MPVVRDGGTAGRGVEVLCVGELLWDSLPEGLFLGGAPFNVACHLRANGLPVAMVSRIGDDRLGDEAMERAARYGIDLELLQVDGSLPTGFVRVRVDEGGTPSYDILQPAAWDAIATTDALLRRAAAARAIVFGTLAQRNAVSRATVRRLWESDALMVCDLNLRPPFVDRAIVEASLGRAAVVKLSEEELARVGEWFAWSGDYRVRVSALASRFGCPVVCLTRGRNGAVLLRDGRWTEHPGYAVEVRDTVGAGDAFLAVLLAGLLAGADDETLLKDANMAGAYVVTQFGAVPADQGATSFPIARPAPAVSRARRRRR